MDSMRCASLCACSDSVRVATYGTRARRTLLARFESLGGEREYARKSSVIYFEGANGGAPNSERKLR